MGILRTCIRLAYASYCIHGLGLQPVFGAPPAELQKYHLVFSDEFDAFDIDFGGVDSGRESHEWYEGVWFSKRHTPRENFAIGSSALTLVWNSGQPQPDSSISTFSPRHPKHHAWRYGYFEARMKWQPVVGAWPAFWLIPVQAATNEGQRESGEIDIFEGQGSQPRMFFGTIHRWSSSRQLESNSPHNRFRLPPATDFAEFHTYGLLWVPGRVTWYFDGVPLHSEQTYEIFDRQDYFLVIGMQEGVDWKEGDQTGVTAQSLRLTVDWVRVWQRATL